MIFTTAKLLFLSVYKLQKIHYFKGLSTATVQLSWKSLFATRSFHHVILIAHVRQLCPANHSAKQLTRSAGSSLSILVYPCRTVIIFILELRTKIIQQAFVKLTSGLLLGLRNSDHHHLVSVAVYLTSLKVSDTFNGTNIFLLQCMFV